MPVYIVFIFVIQIMFGLRAYAQKIYMHTISMSTKSTQRIQPYAIHLTLLNIPILSIHQSYAKQRELQRAASHDATAAASKT